MTVLIVGLDAASQWKNFGYALGEFDGERITVEIAGVVQRERTPNALEALIAARLARADKALIAIDAPLGWPSRMGKTLGAHRAGQSLAHAKDDLFRRIKGARLDLLNMRWVVSGSRLRTLAIGSRLNYYSFRSVRVLPCVSVADWILSAFICG